MDYLHGDVDEKEAELACSYEYARESQELREDAKERDDNLEKHPKLDCKKLVLSIVQRSSMNGRVHRFWECCFLMCRGFPTKDWNELSKPDRVKILRRYETRQVPRLPMPDLLFTPQAVSMLAGFKQLADANTPPIQDVRPGEKSPPLKRLPAMLQKAGSVYWCVFELDFSESKNRALDRFLEWLNQSAIKKLWQKHKDQRTKRPGAAIHALRVRRRSNSVYFCLFQVDLSARKSDLTKQFKKWLALPENRHRLRRYRKESRGTTGGPFDRLRDLAAWRLYREHGNRIDDANEFAKAHRKAFKNWPEVNSAWKRVNGKSPYSPGDPRPFHNAKSVPPVSANQADLFSSDEDYRHAKMRVTERLSKSNYREFRKPSPWMAEVFAELIELDHKR
jgi:hypothetical protein